MKRYFIIILTLLSVSSSSQTKSETDKTKHFLSDDALEFDLVGKIKNVEWIVIDSTVAGNDGEFYKGYYKGTIDSIKLLYDTDLKLLQSDLVHRSIKTYEKNENSKIVFKMENILLDKYSDLSAEDLSQTSYRKLIKDNKLIGKIGLHQLFYNEFGDVKEVQTLDKEFVKRNKSTEKIEYKYKYDKIGNWIERVIITGPENNRFITQTDIRKIEYQ